MSTNRIKKSTRVEITREDADDLMHGLTLATARRNELMACMDTDLAAVRATYSARLSAEADLIEGSAAKLESWANANAAEFPKGAKSLDMTHGRLGFRTGTPRLALLKGQKWDSVLGLVKSLMQGVFLRKKEEVAKDEILAANARGEVSNAQLRDLFRIEVRQDESFFIEPKLEDARHES